MKGILMALAVAGAIWLLALLALYVFGRRSQARELARLLPNLLILFRGLLRDRRVPRRAKWLLGFALVWIASPIDLVPEFLPVIGPLDDAIVAALALRYLLRHTDRSVLIEHWRGDRRTLDVIAGRSAGPESAGSNRVRS